MFTNSKINFKYVLILITCFYMNCNYLTMSNDELDPPPVSGFILNKSTYNVNENIHIINTSEMSVGYKWEFSDGGVSDKHTPDYFFVKSGNYNIYLTAYSKYDSSAKISKPIIVVDSLLMANFKLDRNEFCINESIPFNAEVNGSSVNYKWDFGDKSPPSSESMTSYAYKKSGVYSVTLSIYDRFDTTQVSKIVTIRDLVKLNIKYLKTGTQVCNSLKIGYSGLEYTLKQTETLSIDYCSAQRNIFIYQTPIPCTGPLCLIILSKSPWIPYPIPYDGKNLNYKIIGCDHPYKIEIAN